MFQRDDDLVVGEVLIDPGSDGLAEDVVRSFEDSIESCDEDVDPPELLELPEVGDESMAFGAPLEDGSYVLFMAAEDDIFVLLFFAARGSIDRELVEELATTAVERID